MIYVDLRPFHFVLKTCNTTGRYPPTILDCIQYFNQTDPFVSDILINETNIGFTLLQAIRLPFTGAYTVTVAGASGGQGVCSRNPGKGVVLKLNNITINKGETFSVFVGQKGTSACDTNPSHPVCQLDEMSKDFEDRCLELLVNTTDPEELLFDGGGGGGGETRVYIQNAASDIRQVSAGGGGGAPAIPSNISQVFANSMAMALSEPVMNGVGSSDSSAGAGGAFGLSSARLGRFRVDGNQKVPGRELFFGGGEDCLIGNKSIFPNTVGGSGGGGGGCGNGGGGGGWWGGNVTNSSNSNTFVGGGGAYYTLSLPPPSVVGFNDGDGYAELFYELCSCAYKCIPDFDNELFECVCPHSTDYVLASDGKDCIRSKPCLHHLI